MESVILFTVSLFLFPQSQAVSRDSLPPKLAPEVSDAIKEDITSALDKAKESTQQQAIVLIGNWKANAKDRIEDYFLWHFSFIKTQWRESIAMYKWIGNKAHLTKEEPGKYLLRKNHEQFIDIVLEPPDEPNGLDVIADKLEKHFIKCLADEIAKLPAKHGLTRETMAAELSSYKIGAEVKLDKNPQSTMAEFVHAVPDIADFTPKVDSLDIVELALTVAVRREDSVLTLMAPAYWKPEVEDAAIEVAIEVTEKEVEEKNKEAAEKVVIEVAEKVGKRIPVKIIQRSIPFINVAFAIWDYHSLKKLEESQRPEMKKDIERFLNELEKELIENTEEGILATVENTQISLGKSILVNSKDIREDIKVTQTNIAH